MGEMCDECMFIVPCHTQEFVYKNGIIVGWMAFSLMILDAIRRTFDCYSTIYMNEWDTQCEQDVAKHFY